MAGSLLDPPQEERPDQLLHPADIRRVPFLLDHADELAAELPAAPEVTRVDKIINGP